MTGADIKRIREALSEALGRHVSQADLATLIGMGGARSAEHVRGWEDGSRPVSGPAAIALRYLSHGLPGFRGDIPEWMYSRHSPILRYHADTIIRHWWPRFVVYVQHPDGLAKLGDVSWIDDPCDQAAGILARCKAVFMLS